MILETDNLSRKVARSVADPQTVMTMLADHATGVIISSDEGRRYIVRSIVNGVKREFTKNKRGVWKEVL